MATYVISDIHGEYKQFMILLEKIHFTPKDKLYILGDVLDRGPNPVKVVLEMMKHPNIIPIAGNHEVMAIPCLRFILENTSTIECVRDIDEKIAKQLIIWQKNGSVTTTDEFHKLEKATKTRIVEYIENFALYEEVKVNDRDYILVHVGLADFHPSRPLYDYSLNELVWERIDYEYKYFKDKYIITGHTPTQNIAGNPRPGYIYTANNHIAIDCGSCFGGRLAAMCLDTGDEFYSKD